jgi:hypothetical protein
MLAPLLVALALSTSTLFSTAEPLELEIDAPLRDLMTHLRADDYAVTGALTVVVDGKPVRIDGVKIALRGHTSRRETECDFPKLKIALPQGTGDRAPCSPASTRSRSARTAARRRTAR